MNFEQIIGSCIAVIMAGMPAMIALLKIRELHIAVNSRMDKFIEETARQSNLRESASLVQSEERIAGIAHSRDLLVVQNTQLIEHLAQLAKLIDALPCSFAKPSPCPEEGERTPQ